MRARCIQRHLLGASRSWTVRVNALVIALDQAMPLIQEKLPQLTAWLPGAQQMHLAAVVAAVAIALRVKTRLPLGER